MVSYFKSLDDEDLRALNLFELRSKMSIVQQEPMLFDSTIADNIAYGDTSRDVGLEEIIDVARMANVHDFIVSLPAVGFYFPHG
jgi:ABC-type multidrug transport system fused ATPase/permease subunit